MTFTLQSELTINDGGITEKNGYETILLLEVLEQDKDSAIFYNKGLNMHFMDDSKITTIYEIEFYKIGLTLSETLEKASDFTRRLMLRYDSIQPKVNAQGKVVAVQNIAELKNDWQLLKAKILEDYEGDAVVDYLNEMEEKMQTQNFVLSPMSQYFFFGLLFPGIPVFHSNDWKKTRHIEISDYEEELFQETISFDKETEDIKLYRISGNTSPDSKLTLEDFSGLIRVKKEDFLPLQADVTIAYNLYKQSYQWVFKLEQY
jgi:hypothetical protein